MKPQVHDHFLEKQTATTGANTPAVAAKQLPRLQFDSTTAAMA
jgi:hypothetical protein